MESIRGIDNYHGSIFKYSIICCIDKASEENFQYQIGYVQIEKLWFYTEEKIFK